MKLTAAWPNIFKPKLKVLLLFKLNPVIPLTNSPILPPAFPANISGWAACKANCWVKKPIPLCDRKNLVNLATSLAECSIAVDIPPLINPSEKLSIKPKNVKDLYLNLGYYFFYL